MESLAVGPVPAESTLTRSVAADVRSWTKTSTAAFVSPATRLVALLMNETTFPSAEIAGTSLVEFASTPAESTLTRVVVPLVRSRTKTSSVPFESPVTRLFAWLENATTCPSAETAGGWRRWLTPAESTLTRRLRGEPT